MTTEIERRLTRSDERQLLQCILDVLERGQTATSEAIERLAGRAHQRVLLEELIVITAGVAVVRSPGATIGSALLFNYTAGDVVVCSGQVAGSSAPVAGVGVALVPAGAWRSVAINDTAVTVFAEAAGSVSLELFTGMTAFGSGVIS